LKNKKILLFGPIGDFGGRELEAGFIANALNNEYNVKICSTVYCTERSQVFNFIAKEQMFSLSKAVINKHLLIKICAFIAYMRFGFKFSVPFYFYNTMNKKYFKLVSKTNQVIEGLVAENDVIIICAQLTSNYLKEVVKYAYLKNIPVIFRTTGTISVYNSIELTTGFDWLEKVTTFMHHSEVNAKKLSLLNKYNYIIIDQCAYNEEKLLRTPSKTIKISNFLVLSRLSKEKQVDIVIKAFNNIGKPTDYLHIYGTGPELVYLKQLAANNSNIVFYGHIAHSQSHELFIKHDCLLISSSEEAGPLTGIEAMAAGLPIISTKVGAMSERLPDHIYWYDGSQEQLELKMQKIKELSISEVNSISKAIRQRYVEKYSMETIKKKYQNVVHKALFAS